MLFCGLTCEGRGGDPRGLLPGGLPRLLHAMRMLHQYNLPLYAVAGGWGFGQWRTPPPKGAISLPRGFRTGRVSKPPPEPRRRRQRLRDLRPFGRKKGVSGDFHFVRTIIKSNLLTTVLPVMVHDI